LTYKSLTFRSGFADFMRRLSLRLAVAFIAFAIGLGAFAVSRSPQTVAYCEVARNGEKYHNKIIRVRATIIFGSGGMYIFEDCDPVEALASVVEMDRAGYRNTRGYVEELLVWTDDSSLKKVEAVIEGRFNAEFSTGCWGPKYHITASKVELLTPISDYTPPQVGNEGLRMKH
jgi:hypothetical protein